MKPASNLPGRATFNSIDWQDASTTGTASLSRSSCAGNITRSSEHNKISTTVVVSTVLYLACMDALDRDRALDEGRGGWPGGGEPKGGRRRREGRRFGGRRRRGKEETEVIVEAETEKQKKNQLGQRTNQTSNTRRRGMQQREQKNETKMRKQKKQKLQTRQERKKKIQ